MIGRPMIHRTLLVGFLALLAVGLLWPTLAAGQGVLVVVDPNDVVRLPRPIIIYPPPHPRPPQPRPTPPAQYKIDELDVGVRIEDQVAQVQVSQTFENTGSRQLEVSFVFPLPYDGAVESMTLMVDGKEHPARLLDADEARKMYEEIVRKNRDPALLEWMGTGLFRTSVFPVPAGAKRTVTLRYSQLCRQDNGLTDFLLPLSTAKYTSEAIDRVHIRATIESQQPIRNVYSPTHAVKIKRPDKKHAVVEYTAENEIPEEDFRLFHDTGEGKVSTRVITYRPDKGDEGYFLLLANPRIESDAKKPPKKTIVFVVDRSGSMSGKKIEQARQAAGDVLGTLRKGDLLNIVAYDSRVEQFRPELQRYDDDTRKAALGFIEGLYAGGSTNIGAALETALGQLHREGRPSYVLFLTDGLPTAGETNEMKLAQLARQKNKADARLFTFGVGFDVNARLLDKLSRDGGGQSSYVRPNEDIETAVGRIAGRLESPVMTDVEIAVEFDSKSDSRHGKPISRVYPKGTLDLFAGEQLVLVGRYKATGQAKVVITGQVEGRKQSLDFPAKFIAKSKDDSHAFVEKLWAVRRIGEIIDQIDLDGENDELIEELVTLSKRHGILTPYTSFMADENTRLDDVAGNRRRATDRLKALADTSGRSGVLQRSLKGGLKNAQQFNFRAPAAEAAEAMDAAAAPAGPAATGQPQPGQIAGRAGGGAGFGVPQAAPAQPRGRMPAQAGARTDGVSDELRQAEQTVRRIGHRTFFRREGQWIDSQLTEEQQKEPKRIKQFSDEYFRLADTHGREVAQYLVFDEPVLLAIEGEAYLIEP